eukprot:scaffold7529_cov138-Skeletonema_dohrnii-CCMP3373.AAC.5
MNGVVGNNQPSATTTVSKIGGWYSWQEGQQLLSVVASQGCLSIYEKGAANGPVWFRKHLEQFEAEPTVLSALHRK